MAAKYFICPACRTLVRKSKRLFELSARLGEEGHKYEVMFLDVDPIPCPVCRHRVETEKIIKGTYDSELGPYGHAVGAAILSAIPFSYVVSLLVNTNWWSAFLLSAMALLVLGCGAVLLGVGRGYGKGVPEYRERAKLYHALEVFHCDKCDHPFGEDNAFYPRNGRLPPLRGRMKCANCGEPLFLFSYFDKIFGGILVGPLFVTFYVGIAAAIIEANSSIVFPRTIFGVHVLIAVAAFGAVAGAIFFLGFMQDRKRRVALIALHERISAGIGRQITGRATGR